MQLSLFFLPNMQMYWHDGSKVSEKYIPLCVVFCVVTSIFLFENKKNTFVSFLSTDK